ncbi:MAG TPA: M48 family metalloprotease, partial [bacterium]|nr:M48 family metalloprotease [bacterium]
GGGGGQAQAILLIVALVIAILAPICARLLYFACSRRREYLADASAARFTRYPEGLASALEKISSRMIGAPQVSRALAPLYIVNPLQGRALFSLFSTHPPTEKRVEILRSMAGGAGYLDYEKAYAKVWGERKRCIGTETLQSEGEQISIRAPIPEMQNRQDAVKQAQEVGDLLGRIMNFLLIPCACGVRIKVPPEFNRPEIACPRCGRNHALSEAQKLTDVADSQTGDPMVFQRQATGWESVECSCGKSTQIGPNFSGNKLRCSQCGQEIQILSK